MFKRLSVVALALGAILGSMVPANADHPTGGPHPTFRTENVFLHCNGGNKVQNTAATGATGWDTTAPAQSATAGAGCVMTDPNLVAAAGTAQENIYDAVFSGTFTGNLRDLTVKLHSLVLSKGRTGGTLALRVRLAIDGEQLFTTTTDAKSVTVTPQAGTTPVTEFFEFSIRNLGFANYVYNAEGELEDVVTGGIANEEGDGDDEHLITISVDTLTAPSQGLWALDATEVPSGITFNPATLAAAKITSPLPQGGA